MFFVTFQTFDLMDEIDTTGQYTEPPFCPNSTSFNQKSAQVQQQFYQHSQLFNTSFDDITGNQHVVPEMDMDQFYDSIVNNQYQVSPNDKDILRTDCQYTTQDFYNHNVQDVIATPVNTEYIGNSEEDADLSFPEIPALTGRFPEVPKYMPESNVQSIPHHDESSNGNTYLMHQQQTALENIVGKEEIARYEQFLLFPQCFPHNQIIVSPFIHIFCIISSFFC